MLTSKIITEIIENHSGISVWANSCSKLFEVDLGKPWNYLWYCYEKHLLHTATLFKGQESNTSVMSLLSCIPEEFTLWHVATKCAVMKLAKTWMTTTSPPIREIPAMLVRPCVQNVPGKIGEASPAGYTHAKAARSSPKDQVEWLHLRPCLVPSWCRASRTIWDFCWPWGISSPPMATGLATLARGKTGTKMNNRDSIHDNAQIKSSSTLSRLLDFIFMATRVACLPQNAFSNCMLCTTW